jgi:tetratricopeptide (TPR) repeat protein
MGAVTYPDERVAKFLSLNFVPVQLQSSHTAMMQKFSVSWTPTLIVLDADGREHYRAVGFFTPEDMIATFMTAKGRWALDTDQLADARALFEEVISLYPDKDAAAEALFFLGVAKYKISHDPKLLRETYDQLKARFPQSMWTKQADHYRLIGK